MSEIRNEIRDVKWLPIGDVKENPRNRNKHPEHQLKHLAKIIKAHGFRHPLIVSSRSGLLVSGHGRLAAARLLGLDTVPVATQDFASEAEEYQFGVADNAIALQAEIDLEGIVADMPTLGDFDHDLLGVHGLTIQVPESDFPALRSGDQTGLRTMSFVITEAQKQILDLALAKARAEMPKAENQNENSAALEFIAARFIA